MPPSLSAMGLPDELADDAVAGVAVENQSIVIHLRPELEAALGGTQVALTPYMDQSRLVWECAGTLGAEFLSQACSGARFLARTCPR